MDLVDWLISVIINLSTTQSLGVYFHTGTLPTEDNADLGIKAGYASADNILLTVLTEIFNDCAIAIFDVWPGFFVAR